MYSMDTKSRTVEVSPPCRNLGPCIGGWRTARNCRTRAQIAGCRLSTEAHCRQYALVRDRRPTTSNDAFRVLTRSDCFAVLDADVDEVGCGRDRSEDALHE